MKTIEEYVKDWKNAHSLEEQQKVQKELEQLFGNLGIDNGVMHVYKHNVRITVSEIGAWIEVY